MYFNLRKGGWTESFYSGSALNTAYAAVEALADKRIMILVNAGSLDFVGVRDLGVPRRSTFSPLGSFRTGIAGLTKYRDLYNAAAMVRFNTINSASNNWLHGLPDDWMIGDAAGNFTLTGDGLAGINAYLAFLVNQNTWQLRVQTNQIDPFGVAVQNITYVAGVLTFTIPGTALVAGDRLIVTGAQGHNARQFNGTYRVISVTGNAVVASTARPLTTDFTYVGNTAAPREHTFDFAGVGSADIRKVGTKKMGRPINGPVGRRRG